jgi:hypothetical protein
MVGGVFGEGVGVGSKHRLAAALLSVATLIGRSVPADGAQAGGPSPAPTPKPTSAPKTSPRYRRSIRLSIDDAVTEVMRSHERPCERADRDGVPCFPVTVETEGPRFSVSEALRRYRAIGKPEPSGAPTRAEIQKQLTGTPRSPLVGYSSDPGCVLKSLVRMIGGGGNTFFLYRTQDPSGTRPLLTDRRLSRETLALHPEVRELLGEYFGECDAIAAWRKALREQLAAEKEADDPSPREATPQPTPPQPSAPVR